MSVPLFTRYFLPTSCHCGFDIGLWGSDPSVLPFVFLKCWVCYLCRASAHSCEILYYLHWPFNCACLTKQYKYSTIEHANDEVQAYTLLQVRKSKIFFFTLKSKRLVVLHFFLINSFFQSICRHLRDKGEDDKMPPIRKRQRGLLLRLQQEKVTDAL